MFEFDTYRPNFWRAFFSLFSLLAQRLLSQVSTRCNPRTVQLHLSLSVSAACVGSGVQCRRVLGSTDLTAALLQLSSLLAHLQTLVNRRSVLLAAIGV